MKTHFGTIYKFNQFTKLDFKDLLKEIASFLTSIITFWLIEKKNS